jgi:hypothetical protein
MRKMFLFILLIIQVCDLYGDNRTAKYAGFIYDIRDKIAYNQYLDINNFKSEFNKRFGEKTGVSVSVLILGDDFINPFGHDRQVLKVGKEVRISKDVKLLAPGYNFFDNSDVDKIIYKYNIKVFNYAGVPYQDGYEILDELIKTLKDNDVLFVQAAGNGKQQYELEKAFKSAVNYDNMLAIGNIVDSYIATSRIVTSLLTQLFILPLMPDSRFDVYEGNNELSDFSVFGINCNNHRALRTCTAGTSESSIVASVIIAQYYTIQPCWSYQDMKKFIYATLRPTSELGISNDNTKSKKYMKYDTRIFDNDFIQSIGLPVCIK